mgnify:CR=1 FL=1
MKRSVVLLALLATGCATARPAPAPQSPTPARANGAAPTPGTPPATMTAGMPGGGTGGGATAGEPNPKPYAQVITAKAVTRSGLFKTHRVGSKLFFEIPRQEQSKDMLLVTRIAKTTQGVGYGGEEVDDRVVRWDRQGDRILLRGINYNLVAADTLPIAQAVANANYYPVIAAFNVEAYAPDSAAVIDVTRLYTTNIPEFGLGSLAVANRQRIGQFDASRAFIERVAAFPDNVEVQATHTYSPPPPPPPTSVGPATFFMGGGSTASFLMHYSMVRLPERPMMPRLYDSRVGYFTTSKLDFGTAEHRVARRRFINRWRLEPKDPQAIARGELTEPVQPIVYYVDAATPRWLVPFVKRGIEAWQPAFEAAGFRHAIVAREAPADSADWSPEDARHSVVRWYPSTTENAYGPSIVDPRTGEILDADIGMFHNIMNLQRAWYFTQVAPLDPRAQKLPMPDSLMGKLVEYVVAHEVGHTLGFPHNMKSSSTYEPDSVRSVSFLRRMGHTPSIMDYSRFNYVAQPEDNVPPELLIPGVGPYDVYATMWGYRPIPGATTPEAEKPVLNQWARMQDTAAYLRFMTSNALGADPGELTEAVGDADAVKSTTLGVRNIRRVLQLLEPATAREGEDYTDLAELFGRTVDQWTREMGHVAAVVGGAETRELRVGQPGERVVPIAPARQRQAVQFLNREAFRTPEYFLDPGILRKIEVEGAIDRVGRAQASVLGSLLNNARLARMIEFEALAARPAAVYPLGDMLADVRRGVWSEVYGGAPRVDAFRRRLQRVYLEEMGRKINPPPAPPVPAGVPAELAQFFVPRSVADARPLLRGELMELDTALRQAVARTSDRTTRLHLLDARAQIDRILNPER